MSEQSHDQEKFIVRMPAGMRDRIRKRAAEEGRSMNAEVLQTLEKAYPASSDIDATLREIGEVFVKQMEERDPAIIRELEQQLADLYDVLKYEKNQAGRSYDDFIHDEYVASLTSHR
jgi:plasmid stability protein